MSDRRDVAQLIALFEAIDTIAPTPPPLTVAETAPKHHRLISVGAFTIALLMIGFAFVWFADGPAGDATDDIESTTGPPVVHTGETPPDPQRPGITLGTPQPVPSPGSNSTLHATESDAYAWVPGVSDAIKRWDESAGAWPTVLLANPGDAAGLVTAGRLILQVVEDRDPDRDTVAPFSAVTDAPRVQIYDPTTGDTWGASLPRPTDPVMEPLPEGNSGTSECPLFGYQSFVQANAAAVGHRRLIVTGSLDLVGRMEDGTVRCLGSPIAATWTSDDDGHTWVLNEGPLLSEVEAIDGGFVAWATGGDAVSADVSSVPDLLISPDGSEWQTAARRVNAQAHGFPAGLGIDARSNAVIAWVNLHEWSAQIPDVVNDPAQLAGVLGTDDVTSTLDLLNVDLPLDDSERDTIRRFVGTSIPTATIVSVSSDGGATWVSKVVQEPIGEIAVVDGGFVATAARLVDETETGVRNLQVLSSQDGFSWREAFELPVEPYGSTIASTDQGVFIATGAEVWQVPLR